MTELTLADRFKKYVAMESAPIIQPGATGLSPEDFALPASLVDDELLRELARIPDRLGFKIGEVAQMLDIKPYVLRYWESEFPELRPKKANNNQRYYTRKEVELAFVVRKLLHRDKYSIEGAKLALKNSFKDLAKQLEGWKKERQEQREIKTFLARMIKLLEVMERKLESI